MKNTKEVDSEKPIPCPIDSCVRYFYYLFRMKEHLKETHGVFLNPNDDSKIIKQGNVSDWLKKEG